MIAWNSPPLTRASALLARLRGLDLVAFLAEQAFEREQDAALVIDDQQAAFHWRDHRFDAQMRTNHRDGRSRIGPDGAAVPLAEGCAD